MIVPVGRPSSLRFIGRQLYPTHLRFSCDYTHQIEPNYTHLAGLLILFRNKRTSAKRLKPPPANDAVISAKFKYDWVDFSFKLTPIPGSFASDRRLSAIQADAIAEYDPIKRIHVTAIWDDFPVSALQRNAVLAGMPASTASRLRLALSSDLLEAMASTQIPSARIHLTNPALKLLKYAQSAAIASDSRHPAAPRPVVDVRKKIPSMTSGSRGVAAGADTAQDGRSQRKGSERESLSALDTFFTEVGEYVAAAAVQDDTIDEQFVTSAVASLFEMNLGHGIMADVVDAIGPNAAETTVLERLARLLAASETLNATQKLWNLFLDGVEVHWEQGWVVGGVPFNLENGPDHNASLVIQKLQMINCCIERRRHEALRASATLQGDAGQDRGRKNLLKGIALVAEQVCTSEGSESNSDQVWEPYVQPGPFMTRDMVEEEQQRMVRRAEAKDTDDESEVRRQSLTLKSDMMAFKAANPNATMADFVRWFSPADWITAEELEQQVSSSQAGTIPDEGLSPETNQTVVTSMDATGASKDEGEGASLHFANRDGAPAPEALAKQSKRQGRLSARMSCKGNVWEELWNEADDIPAAKQVPLFDASAHGSKALGDLRAMPLSQVLMHLAVLQGSGAAMLLHTAFCRNPALPGVRGEIERAKQMMRNLSCSLPIDEADVTQLGHVAEALDRVGVAEHAALVATSVFTKLPPVEGLGHIVDSLACGQTAEVSEERERELITRMAGLGDGGWRSILLPEQREFVIMGRSEDINLGGLKDRMYARLSRDEFRVGFRLGIDYSV
ncbi:unnamed protein product [Chondrus crispus]|uniref:Rab3 GTPase-activating protein catalytic subunit n=1 Tax=Chondrus crispus TaxID=2769 RepID=R7QPH1_CHOCR|nr:unnamed protein product [Chondrus crispus]CDF39386.1 unnamed protein product [Chondrus crispus]|eukprot:XP_005719297.1 unnamed protein product [Chondrus crispus]